MIRQAVIFAGGKGTRLLPLTKHTPKPLIDINGKPFLDYILGHLKRNGIEEVILLVGYLHDQVIDYYGDGEKHGLKITYGIGAVEDQTGKRLRSVKDQLQDEFLALYCDNYLPVDIRLLYAAFKENGLEAQMTIYDNKDHFTKDNVEVRDGKVVRYDRSRTAPGLGGVDAGYFIVKRRALRYLGEGNEAFQDTVVPALIRDGQLGAFVTGQRYYGVGKLERLDATKRFLVPKKAIFLDRDGVINKKAPKAEYVKNWGEFEFLPGVLEALALLKKKGYEVFIISNQAGIARGMMTEQDLTAIHERMLAEIEAAGGHVEAIYYCPHGWDDRCGCRKPKPGMLQRASKEHFIDLTTSLFVGDDERDKQAGDAASMRTVLVSENMSLLDVVKGL
ncbi:HAD-IIIA family hydrolase [Candidatus Woesearchaeota archaeon]|nr:HAD-IIIA family hydrolase [Candidatus Woesearchaeota archaeon]